MKAIKRWLHLGLVFCLAFGWAFSVPLVFPTTVLADDSPPPAEESGLAPQVEATPLELTPEEIELRAAMDAFELARQQGPEAMLALRETLHGRALDLLMDDIQKAQAELARSAPPLPETAPVSPEEEEAIVQAQAELDLANRPQPLGIDPALTLDENPAAEPAGAETSGDAKADRTVGSPPCTYATILAAMNAASNGDRLLLEGGRTFTENLSVQKSLTFQGGYAGCGSGASTPTTIDAGGSGRGMYIYQNLVVTLENLNIINASTTGYGAGIFVHNNSQVTGNNVQIYNNTTSDLGGGVFLYGATATFTNSNIYSNTAMSGAGVYGMFFNAIAPVLNLPSYADVYSNNALTGSGLGGGVYMDQGTVSLADCSDIYSNDAILGGGAYLATSTLTVAGDCSEIMYNTATGNGGGIYALTSTVNLDEDAELYFNQAGYGGGSGNGGGAYLDASDLWGDKALIYYNTATTYGGGVYATNSSLLDMDLGGYACSGPRCSQLSYNTATNLYGGGVYATTTSEIDLRQVFIESNAAQYGGAVYMYQGPFYLYNSLVARNNATGGVGDGLRVFSTGATLTGQHNTLANNDASGAATGAAISITSATLTLSNSIIWNHTTSIDLVGQIVTCSDIQGGYTGAGNLNVNPLFVNPADSNFHLQSLSPVIDSCATGQSNDFDNEARPVTYVRPAIPYDMGADEASARVGINGAACAYGRIQDAVDAAVSGDIIQAEADTFTERVFINGKNLTIAGGYDMDCIADLAGRTTVNGGGGGSVFEITTPSTLTLRDLDITGGIGSTGGGLAVYPGASQVTLDNTDVFSNQANYGGGVYVDIGNVLTLTNDSDIQSNTAAIYGGGARVWGTLVGNDWNSAISDNSAPDAGGVSVPGGVMQFNGSHVMVNHAFGASGKGGGIHVYNGGSVTLAGSSNISHNTAFDGAGIYADSSSVDLGNGMVYTNSATNNGGGVYLYNSSTLTSTNAYIGFPYSGYRNTALNGAGLYSDASTVNFTGYIYNNVAVNSGGGIYASGGTLNLTNADVGGSDAYEPNQLGPIGHKGAGLYLTDAVVATLTNTIVSSNTFQTVDYTYGGGAYVTGGSTLTLYQSTFQLNQALNAFDGRGAGLYVENSTATLDASQVLSNTAGTVGGGIRLFGTSTLNIQNGSEVSGNHATTGAGGAIHATGTPDINISSSSLNNNVAGTDGGAVYLDTGTLDFTGWWGVSDNSAGGNGGAVAVVGTGNAGFISNTAGSSILNNHASGNGGALYLNNSTTLELHSTSGYLLSLSGNYASGNGGAAYADNGGYFDVYGKVVITANRATAGNGGAFYLSNASRVWFDDYVNDAPEIRVNWAQNGGAIYATDSPRVECDGAKFGYEPEGNYTTAGSGGAIYLLNSTFNADNCTFFNNMATADGGAIAAYTSTLNIYATFPGSKAALERANAQEILSPQDIKSTACNPLSGQCSGLYGNLADSDGNTVGNGGAIFSSASNLTMNATYLHHNQATRGGGIYQEGAGAVANVTNTLIYGNTVSVALGAGIRSAAGTFNLTHSTLAYNLGGSGFSGTATEVRNSIAWGNSALGFATTPLVAACNIDDGGLAGLNLDPRFVAPGAGEDYHLLSSSPAVNACATGLSPDLDNVPRPFGSAYDMGAFEFFNLQVFLPIITK